MGRNDIHLVPLHMTERQESYLKPSPRKTHVLTADGVTAAAAGIKFFQLGNGVVVSRGINGLIPPCCISSLWSNTNMGRRSLSIDEALAKPPIVAPVTSIPDHGPPIKIQGYNSPAPPKARLTQRVTPPRDVEPSYFPVPPQKSASPVIQSTVRPPTPSQLSLPEIERPHHGATVLIILPKKKTCAIKNLCAVSLM